MSIPLFVVNGFLSAGKSSLINSLLVKRKRVKRLLILTERGEEPVRPASPLEQVCYFPQRMLRRQTQQVIHELLYLIRAKRPEEIWLEWNGTLDYRFFEQFLKTSVACGKKTRSLLDLVALKSMIFVVSPQQFPLIRQAGCALPPFLSDSDVIVLRDRPGEFAWRQARVLVGAYNSRAPIAFLSETDKIDQAIGRSKRRTWLEWLLPLAIVLLLLSLIRLLIPPEQFSFNGLSNRLISISLQAFPFLILGVLLSSAIQSFVPGNWLENHFPRNPILGILYGLIAGFFLPVCDCASIPVYHGLLRKGVPLSAATAFMLASPVINPVVLLSTRVAFPDLPSLIWLRPLLGLLVAALVALGMIGIKPGQIMREDFDVAPSANCGCFESWHKNERSSRLDCFIRHATGEFFSIAPYLLSGIFLSSVFQTWYSGRAHSSGRIGGIGAIAAMMFLAFMLSLCSSSDAMIARTFLLRFSPLSVLAFLVFGPMLDLKNILILGHGFRKTWVIRFFLIVSGITLAVFGLISLVKIPLNSLSGI